MRWESTRFVCRSPPPHLPQKQQDRGDRASDGVPRHPQKMGKYLGVTARQHRPRQLHRVDEGQSMGNLLEYTAHQLQVKPDARQPRRQVGEEGAADTAHLLFVENTAEEQTKGNEQEGHGDVQQNGKQDVHREIQPQKQSRCVAQGSLDQSHGEDGESVTQHEIHGSERGGVEPLEKGGAPILGDDGGREQGDEGQPEDRDAGGEAINLKEVHGDVGLDGRQEEQQDQGKAQTEAEGQGIAEDLLGVAVGKGQHSHERTSFTMETKACSKLSVPAASLMPRGVSQTSSLPSLMMATRSDSASASSM